MDPLPLRDTFMDFYDEFYILFMVIPYILSFFHTFLLKESLRNKRRRSYITEIVL